ncbi:MAG: hypothetical protein P0Y60_05905 [Candidatus Microbacterium colombiense]|nr:MAG: hypothetical protein P0Y60_05905 [Microbacterium sp.]
MAEQAGLATEIDAAVRATPGVSSIYRSGSLISNLVGAGAAALGVTGQDEPLVSVVDGDDGLRIEASVGVDFAASALDTLTAARAAIAAVLADRGLRAAGITLTIVYVHSREAS